MITIIEHNRNCWSDMARAAYKAGRNDIGHRYSAAASLPIGLRVNLKWYDDMQKGWREWFNWNRFPSQA